MLGRLLLVCVVCTAAASADLPVQSQRAAQTAEIIKADGFPVETHHVNTSDGYILEMHRIPHGRGAANSTVKRPVVFLMHGLMAASTSYIAIGVTNSFAYNLADEGFDVWMGNARGNYYSRKHITLNPDDNTEKFKFFNFTFEEIGTHDLPAMIDYALEQTGSKQLHYIGHSQGGTVFLVLTTLKPLYNKKIASAHLLAGVGYQKFFPNKVLADLAVNVDSIYNLALMSGIVELYPELLSLIRVRDYDISDYCTGDLKQRKMCELFGVRHILRNVSSSDLVPMLAGASVKQVAHYGQNVRDKLFRRYHYGTEKNLDHYGQAEPPLYNMRLITCNVTMHYSMNDTLLDERDVLEMVADMPNARARKVARDSFDHTDFVLALDAKELVTDYIINALKSPSTAGSPGTASTKSFNIYLTLCSLILIFTTFGEVQLCLELKNLV